MANPFLGQIISVGFNFAPAGWAQCNGQLMAISQNDALFALIGTTYGGDGVTTFALPNLQSRIPVDDGQGTGLNAYVIGQASGTETVTLLSSQIPLHNHNVNTANSPGNAKPAATTVLSDTGPASPGVPTYVPLANPVTLAGGTIGSTGGSTPHNNQQPFLCINFVICLQGVFPARN